MARPTRPPAGSRARVAVARQRRRGGLADRARAGRRRGLGAGDLRAAAAWRVGTGAGGPSRWLRVDSPCAGAVDARRRRIRALSGGRRQPRAGVRPVIVCRTLGPVAVSVDGGSAPPELLWRKNLALLVYLARSPKRARAREHLIGLLWGDKPEGAARHSLNEAVRVLRRHAGEGGVETEAGQVRLVAGAVELDTDRLDTLLAAKDYRSAVALVAGEFLEGFAVSGASAFEDWMTAERALWRGRSVDALLRRADELLGTGDLPGAHEMAQRGLVLDPTSDVAVRAVMRCRALAGDRAGALECYETFAARLAGEVDTEPDTDTKALAERVRRERAWRLPAVAAGAGEAAESRRAPLVGRASELARLLGAWTACRRDRRAAVAIVEGDAGTGKTRLAEELLGWAARKDRPGGRRDGRAARAAIRRRAARSRPLGAAAVQRARARSLGAPGWHRLGRHPAARGRAAPRGCDGPRPARDQGRVARTLQDPGPDAAGRAPGRRGRRDPHRVPPAHSRGAARARGRRGRRRAGIA